MSLISRLYQYHLKKAKEYREDMLNKEEADWQKFKILNGEPLICRITNEPCDKCCITSEEFKLYGCMYIKGFMKY